MVSMPKYTAIIVYQNADEGFLRGIPLSLHLQSFAEAESALEWQKQGGFDLSNYRICKPSAVPGVFEVSAASLALRDLGQPVLIEQGVFTDRAWKEFHLKTWGTA